VTIRPNPDITFQRKKTLMTISRIRPSLRRHVAAAAVLVAGAAAVAVAPAVANASVNACTVTSGKTSNLTTGTVSLVPVGGTIFIKQPPGCLDLNLTKVSASDHYEGWLLNSSTGQWKPCSAGFVAAPPVPKVLCSGVATGTHMAIVQESNTQRTITAEY
jgi:hypothetical protein